MKYLFVLALLAVPCHATDVIVDSDWFYGPAAGCCESEMFTEAFMKRCGLVLYNGKLLITEGGYCQVCKLPPRNLSFLMERLEVTQKLPFDVLLRAMEKKGWLMSWRSKVTKSHEFFYINPNGTRAFVWGTPKVEEIIPMPYHGDVKVNYTEFFEDLSADFPAEYLHATLDEILSN